MQTPQRQAPPAMPFTFRDVALHSFATFVVFLLVVIVWAVVVALSGDAGILGGNWFTQALAYAAVVGVCAFVLVWVFAPLAWLLGRVMQRVSSPALHALAFGALGGAAGAVVAAGILVNGPIAQESIVVSVLVAFICGLCTAVGRYLAYRRSLVFPANAEPAVVGGS